MKSINEKLSTLLSHVTSFGLSETDANCASVFLLHQEYELCLDQIISQLYEHDIATDLPFQLLAIEIARGLKLPTEKYDFLQTEL